MEARAATETAGRIGARLPTWILGLIPLALIVAVAALFAAIGAPGLGERTGPPIEELAVERTVLRPGEIELTVRNDGPDPVRIEQVSVSDSYVTFSSGESELQRLESSTLTIPYPWIEGESYDVILLTSTGATIEHEIAGAVETPETDVSFFALMGLLGVDRRWVRLLLAFTVGLLAFLVVDASLEGLEIASDGPQAFGGTALVFLGALTAFVSLAAIDAALRERRDSAGAEGLGGAYLALLIAVGIGLHNLGEGLAIGSAYTTGALALGVFLVIGFAIHNTTEGLAIVAPLSAARPAVSRLAALGLIAGAPTILGALVGAAAYNASIAAFLLGVGAGAIAQVVLQLVPSIRDAAGRALNPTSALGVLAGLAGLYLTSLLVSV